jgi:hypothetical protein
MAAAGQLAHVDPGVAITILDQALNVQVPPLLIIIFCRVNV